MASVSVLDLMMLREGKQFSDTLSDALELARHVEKHGYCRYWVAEHHNMPGIASSATTLIMSHLAAGTTTLRIGSGGMMMPNHSPLLIAEQFATLNTLYPDRIDLGVGRAPGADALAARAIRGSTPDERELGDDVRLLQDYLADNGRQPVRSVPGTQHVPVWILGAGLQGADLAARMGLPYAFASHFAPFHLQQAIQHYRKNFQASEYLSKPYVMAGINVFAADTREEAEYLASSHRSWVINRNTGRGGPLPLPVRNYLTRLPEFHLRAMESELACTAIGSREEVGVSLRSFLNFTDADELMIDARIYDTAARCRSYQLAAESIQDLLD
ncbi:LLM class flavin-dependent oxidoreductase [Serratia plymuthica]|jgi:luciferase family oxidoreductase group 1|uniref:LLM class flavin-dependent oxidoreductase n=1 Tax=Serratia plymuthica TaxID=82996 RepID=UPI0018D9919A|nr:LLM class flavin-dependent oxidoreductase [Serratia plymuthica]QPS57614.1 LLM class flavin-dependent oxidoreductase [Serratia plymuthica]CAI1541691.1 Limonene 1,2-monooxygenase [Serratia plymuthica]